MKVSIRVYTARQSWQFEDCESAAVSKEKMFKVSKKEGNISAGQVI